MSGYYDEVLEQISKAIQDGNLDDASYLLRQEKSMPYIPEDVEPKLNQLARDLSYAKSERVQDHEDSLDNLLNKLKGKPQSQLSAAEHLSDRNLRVCIDQIREYLGKDPLPEAAALLIEAIAEQEIGEEFILVRNGLEYTFWGDAVTPIAKSTGFLNAMKKLESWFNKEPDMQEMARTLVIHEAYLYLPLSYENDEAEPLALKVAEQVSSMMDDGKSFQTIQKRLETEAELQNKRN